MQSSEGEKKAFKGKVCQINQWTEVTEVNIFESNTRGEKKSTIIYAQLFKYHFKIKKKSIFLSVYTKYHWYWKFK